MDHDEFDNFITYGEADLECDIGDSDYLPYRTIYLSGTTTYYGYGPFVVEAQDEFADTRGMNVSGHVILNFVGTLLTNQNSQLK